jgi:starch synthase
VTAPTIALLPWGDVWENYLDMIGIFLDEFCTEATGTWLFNYVEALDQMCGVGQQIHCPVG